MQKRKYIILSILCLLAVALVMVALFVPSVHIVGKEGHRIVMYDKTVNLITYLKDAPFINIGEVSDVYYTSNGPIWMATTSAMINILVAAAGTGMFVICVISLCLLHKQDIAINNNVVAKKASLFVGWMAFGAAAFSAASYIITTKLANGYVEFGMGLGLFVVMGLAIAIIVLAHFAGRRMSPQTPHRLKDALGFAFTSVCTILVGLIPFLPVYTKDLFADSKYASLFGVTTNVNVISADFHKGLMADIPLGVMFYAIIALEVVCLFVFIYSIIGLIRALRGKSTNWLSSRVKRWSMALMIVSSAVWLLLLAQIAVLSTTTIIVSDEVFTLLYNYVYVLLLVPMLPYIFSTMVAYTKQKKDA